MYGRSWSAESVTAAARAVDYHIDICPHNNNIDIDFIFLQLDLFPVDRSATDN